MKEDIVQSLKNNINCSPAGPGLDLDQLASERI